MDQKAKIEAGCHKSCLKPFSEIAKCEERIKAKGEGNCSPWSFDYIKCIDACVSVYSTFLSVALTCLSPAMLHLHSPMSGPGW